MVERLPKRLIGSLPTVEEIEAELGAGWKRPDSGGFDGPKKVD